MSILLYQTSSDVDDMFDLFLGAFLTNQLSEIQDFVDFLRVDFFPFRSYFRLSTGVYPQ